MVLMHMFRLFFCEEPGGFLLADLQFDEIMGFKSFDYLNGKEVP